MELVIKSECVICESQCQLVDQMNHFVKENPSMLPSTLYKKLYQMSKAPQKKFLTGMIPGANMSTRKDTEGSWKCINGYLEKMDLTYLIQVIWFITTV